MAREVSVALALLLSIGSMLVPLPTGLIDFLLVANLILAFVLLVNALFATDPLKLSSLPTMLLLATLYRLSLNVSTTRLVLSQADAGAVVEAFGSFVVGGNIVVGLVIFLIMTLIQFIVIAKGSERVAEVSARFTLDALPGKQMSIDAELRAGFLDGAGARIKRQELQTESRFYGALDGAMKFIKGDAIAGICITAINLIGGVVIGVCFHDLSLAESVNRYSLLTVGDGVLSQLPALLNALAAGLVVTRVARGDESSLAGEMLHQLGASHRVKLLIGALSLTMALVPAMPALPFLTLGIVLLLSGATGSAAAHAQVRRKRPLNFKPRIPALLSIRVHPQARAALVQGGSTVEALEQFRLRTHLGIGLLLKEPEVIAVEGEEVTSFEILLRGVRCRRGRFGEKADQWGYELGEALDGVVSAHAAELVDDIMTRRILDHLEGEAPDLVHTVVPGIVTTTQLTEVFRRLIGEGVAIRNSDQILQAVAEAGPRLSSERSLLEEVRVGLRRLISASFVGPDGIMRGYALDPALDAALVTVDGGKARLCMHLAGALLNEIERQTWEGRVLVLSKRSRSPLKEYLDLRKVKLTLLAYEEISDETLFECLGQLGAGTYQDCQAQARLAA